MSEVAYLEYKDDKSSKFWLIEVSGTTQVTRFGKIGTEGQLRSKKFSSHSAALADAEAKAEAKRKKGYVVAVDEATEAKLGMEELATVNLGEDLEAEFQNLITKHSAEIHIAARAAEAAVQAVIDLSEKYGVPVQGTWVPHIYGAGGATYWPKKSERFVRASQDENGYNDWPSISQFPSYPAYEAHDRLGWIASSDMC